MVVSTRDVTDVSTDVTDGRRAPASGSTFTSAGLSSWVARSSRAIREGSIPGGASRFHPLPASWAPQCHLLATGTGICAPGHRFFINNVESRESPDTTGCPQSRSFPGDDPLFCSEWLSHTRQRSTISRIGVSGGTLSPLSRTIQFRAQVPISPNPRTAKISNSVANVAESAPVRRVTLSNFLLNTANVPGEL